MARLADWQDGLTTQLQTLRREEDQRGEAAVNRLGELQTAMASHLATLGEALEAPMTRLLETASEAPKAAAEVIAQLRQEMSHLTERDNLALQERTALVGNLGTLLQSVEHATGEQRAAIESLVTSATSVLDQVSQQFSATLETQASNTNEVAAQVAGSAAELASLGEAFHHGVQLFSESNQKLVDKLQSIEGAIAQNMARSDEQLAYYVAQAREVIDLSISSQQGIVEDLRRLRGSSGKAAAPGAPHDRCGVRSQRHSSEDDGVEQAAPVWAVFGDLMAGVVGAFVLILISVLAMQMDLVTSLQSEIEKRHQEEARRMALEKALAIPLQSGRVTLNNGRIGISGSVLFDLNSDELREEGRLLLQEPGAAAAGVPERDRPDAHGQRLHRRPPDPGRQPAFQGQPGALCPARAQRDPRR